VPSSMTPGPSMPCQEPWSNLDFHRIRDDCNVNIQAFNWISVACAIGCGLNALFLLFLFVQALRQPKKDNKSKRPVLIFSAMAAAMAFGVALNAFFALEYRYFTDPWVVLLHLFMCVFYVGGSLIYGYHVFATVQKSLGPKSGARKAVQVFRVLYI